MRSTIVPAQVTTVEDKIAGSLGISQILLLTVPIFGGSALFVLLPPFFNYAPYKIAMILCFAVFCGLLAIRIKGKILLSWLVITLQYNLRPRYYVFDKNDAHLRDMNTAKITIDESETVKAKKPQRHRLPQLSTVDLMRVEELIANPEANLHIKTNRKGELSVHFTEV